jgi:hypothetical protein
MQLLKLARDIEKITGDSAEYDHMMPGLESEVRVMMEKLASMGYKILHPKMNISTIEHLKIVARYYRAIEPMIRENRLDIAKIEGDSWNGPPKLTSED